jgi:hypothetical protein
MVGVCCEYRHFILSVNFPFVVLLISVITILCVIEIHIIVVIKSARHMSGAVVCDVPFVMFDQSEIVVLSLFITPGAVSPELQRGGRKDLRFLFLGRGPR